MAWKILPRRSHKVAIFIFPSSCHKALKLFFLFLFRPLLSKLIFSFVFVSSPFIVDNSGENFIESVFSRTFARTKNKWKENSTCTRTPENFRQQRLSLSPIVTSPSALPLALLWYEVNWIIKYEWRIRVTLNHCYSFTFKSTACTWLRD